MHTTNVFVAAMMLSVGAFEIGSAYFSTVSAWLCMATAASSLRLGATRPDTARDQDAPILSGLSTGLRFSLATSLMIAFLAAHASVNSSSMVRLAQFTGAMGVLLSIGSLFNYNSEMQARPAAQNMR